MSDFSKVTTCSYILAKDSVEAEVMIKRWVKVELEKRYPKSKELENETLLCEVQPENWLLAKEIIGMDFQSKVDWAERDVLNGITEGKPLRESLTTVLCAISEEAYNRGRMSVKNAT
jgi:hypothetical protein